MPDNQSAVPVSQRAREAAADTYVADHPKREETALTHSIRSGGLDRNSRVQALARFESECTAEVDALRAEALSWAVGQWKAEVRDRPLRNVHRRTLDDVWRRVICKFGGDDEALVGPRHDDLCATLTDATNRGEG